MTVPEWCALLGLKQGRAHMTGTPRYEYLGPYLIGADNLAEALAWGAGLAPNGATELKLRQLA